MTASNLIGLASAVVLLAMIPGPGVLATVARSLASGLKPAMAMIGGIVIGDLLYLMSAIYGLSQLAETFGSIFIVVKYAGGAYLIWLGFHLLKSSWNGKSADDHSTSENDHSGSNFFSGLAITLGNPKVIIFYLGFLPAFMDLRALKAGDILVTATVVSGVLGGVLFVYAFAAARARSLISSRRFTQRVDQTAGIFLIGSGSIVIAKS